jgi:hypothetical protein
VKEGGDDLGGEGDEEGGEEALAATTGQSSCFRRQGTLVTNLSEALLAPKEGGAGWKG